MSIFNFNKKKQASNSNTVETEKRLLWNNMNFAATEAYNLLRTNLLLSFADEEGARLVGVTSTEHAEGKSLTSINLAASLAKAGHKTLLLEGDLRMPVIAKCLKVKSHAGLSELLTSMVSRMDEVIFPVEQCKGLDVIFCGRTPPNPSELLGSKRMEVLLQELSKHYDYIIVDLPPVGAVSDALVLSKKLSGMIVVVRNNITTQPELADTIRQLQYTDARILGFVYNDADTSGHGYGKKYYKKYYKYGYYSSSGTEEKTQTPRRKSTNHV